MPNYLALNRIFRALASPTRRLIIEQLCDEDAAVTVLAEPLPVSLVSVMRQIQLLESAGMIRTHKIQNVRTCWLEPQALDVLSSWVTEQRSRWERRQFRPARR
jgi:DNA-binding transcriptional ArsR family regulator